MRIILFAAVLPLFLSGCAANSGVAPLGADTFVVSRQAATGFSGSGNLKGEALTEAGQYCAGQGKSLLVTNTKEAAPGSSPFIHSCRTARCSALRNENIDFISSMSVFARSWLTEA